MIDSWCQLCQFNQSINDCILPSSNSLSKKRYRIWSYQWQIFFIEVSRIGDRIDLSSGYHGLLLKDTVYREQVGRVWKWVILICVGSKPFPDLPSTSLFYTLAAFDYFFSYFNLIIYPSDILPCSPNWEKARREWQFWLEGKLMMAEGRRWGFFRRLRFSLSSSLDWNGLKKDSTFTGKTLR